MFNLESVTKKVIIVSFAIALLALGIGMFFVDDYLAYAKGIAFGSTAAILKMILIEKSTKKMLDMDKSGGAFFYALSFFLRLFMTGAVLVTSALADKINLWGAIIGLLVLQPSAYIVHIRDSKVIKGAIKKISS